MWQFHDSQMKKLQKLYQRTSKQTQNRLQEIFDVFQINFSNLYNIADNKTKKRVNTYIEEWQDKDILKGYFGSLAKNIYGRTRVKNNEILELLIYEAYIEEQNKLEKQELDIIKENVNYYYKQGQEEVNKTLNKKKKVSLISDALFLYLLSLPMSTGLNWNQYIDINLRYNTEQIYRQAVIDMSQGKELKIDSDVFQGIINKQLNAKLSINGDKYSGTVENFSIGINNNAKIEGIKSFDENAKVVFIAVEDNVTTKMCKSLDGQIFNIHDWNEFKRYSKNSECIRKYKCYGLVTGLNLPPINDGFHWCRSYIIYLSNIELDKKYSIFNSKLEKEIKNTYKVNKAKLKDIDRKVLINILNNLEKVYKDFPQIKGKIKEIESIEHPNGGLNIQPDIKDNRFIMQINSKFFSNENIAIKKYENDLKDGFHPRDTTYKDMGIHELGHSITFEIIRNKYYNKKDIINDWNKNITAKEIVEKAFKNLENYDKFTQDILRNNISNYAISNYGETIGEAFADYYANKEKSNILSREIVKVMKGMI